MKILHVVGARPNFMKAAPVMAALVGKVSGEQVLAHTGQHYDSNMSNVFSCQLEIPEPDINLGVGLATLWDGQDHERIAEAIITQ